MSACFGNGLINIPPIDEKRDFKGEQMSWSVSASGKPAQVKAELDRQFSYPLAEGSYGLADAGERETVRRVSETITQCLETFGEEKSVSVSAYGHMGWDSYDTNAGAYQQVTVSIGPAVSS
jgi:hypothetical protein